MNLKNMRYTVSEDINFIMDAKNCSLDEISSETGISKSTLNSLQKNNETTDDVLEKIYSYIYKSNYRINSVKEDILKEENELVLFHGAKNKLEQISSLGSRRNCDFGNGFYLTENYNNALSFVSDYKGSSIYSFVVNIDELKIARFTTSLEWMLAICKYRGTIKQYDENPLIVKIMKEVMDADLIIAPIADNKMFNVMASFASSDINADVAIHSLSASKLGLQYVFKTDKAIERLKPVERYYLCEKEKSDISQKDIARSFEIETKLKMAKMKYKTGLFIEEILK